MKELFNPHTITTRCFIGCLVKRGCGQRAHLIFDAMLANLGTRIKQKFPFRFLVKVLLALKPSVSIWKKKRGGSTFQLPYLITEKKGLEIAIHWLIKEAFNKPNRRDMADSLAYEIIELAAGRNIQIKRKRDEIHKLALSARPFLRFR